MIEHIVHHIARDTFFHYFDKMRACTGDPSKFLTKSGVLYMRLDPLNVKTGAVAYYTKKWDPISRGFNDEFNRRYSKSVIFKVI